MRTEEKRKKIIIATRFFEKEPGKIAIIEKFVHQALGCADQVLVAINTEEDKTGALGHDKLNLPGVQVFGVNPWGGFVSALNTLISKAKINGGDFLLITSAEMKFGLQHVSKLQQYLDENTLAVGAALPGHIFRGGEREGTGLNVPWNTFCLWNLEYLSRTGFPLIGDALFDNKKAGVEEVITIALLQKMYPFLTAKLVKLEGIERDTSLWDEQRRARFQVELANRLASPAAQMAVFNIVPPKVIHINANGDEK